MFQLSRKFSQKVKQWHKIFQIDFLESYIVFTWLQNLRLHLFVTSLSSTFFWGKKSLLSHSVSFWITPRIPERNHLKPWRGKFRYIEYEYGKEVYQRERSWYGDRNKNHIRPCALLYVPNPAFKFVDNSGVKLKEQVRYIIS